MLKKHSTPSVVLVLGFSLEMLYLEQYCCLHSCDSMLGTIAIKVSLLNPLTALMYVTIIPLHEIIANELPVYFQKTEIQKPIFLLPWHWLIYNIVEKTGFTVQMTVLAHCRHASSCGWHTDIQLQQYSLFFPSSWWLSHQRVSPHLQLTVCKHHWGLCMSIQQMNHARLLQIFQAKYLHVLPALSSDQCAKINRSTTLNCIYTY